MKKKKILFILIISIFIVGCENSDKKFLKDVNSDEIKVIENSEEKRETATNEEDKNLNEKENIAIKEQENFEEKQEIIKKTVDEKNVENKKNQLKITYNSITTMKQNQTFKINAMASGANINYHSSNIECVTIDKSGTLKSVWISNSESCNSTITITATKGDFTKKESFNVTVKEDTTPPTIECSIYKEAKNGVYLLVKESDDESGLKEECDPYCFMPIYTKTTTHEVYDKAGNVSTCTVKVEKGCPREYSGYPYWCRKNSRPANLSVGYAKSCKERQDNTYNVKCGNAQEIITGEEAQAECKADTCYKVYTYYCKGEGKFKIVGTTCYDYTDEIVYLGEISY